MKSIFEWLKNVYFVFSELPENWTDTKETLLEGMVFNVKYLGMTLVGQPKGEDMAAAAIRRIVTTVSHQRSRDLVIMLAHNLEQQMNSNIVLVILASLYKTILC